MYHRQYGLTHIVLLRILYKFPPKLLYFFVLKRLLKICIWNITVWPILLIPGSYKNLHQKLFLVFKNLSKKLYQGQYGFIHIVLSRILYKCPPNAHTFFDIKNLLENCIRDTTVWLLFSFSRILSSFHLRFMPCFLFQKSLENLNHGQYGLTYIVHLKNIDQFLSKAHIGNSDQHKLWFEPYYPLKALFCYLKYFWKI